MNSSRLCRCRQTVALSMLAVLCLAGCGGEDEPAATPDDGGSGASSACPDLAKFSNELASTVNAVNSGGDPNQVQAFVAGLKNEYLMLLETLQAEAPQSADDLSAAMQNLQNAVTRLPRDPSPELVTKSLKPAVTAVDDTADDIATELDCPEA